MIQQMIYKGTVQGYQTVAASKGLKNTALLRRLEMLCRTPGATWMRQEPCPIYSRCAVDGGIALGMTVRDVHDNRNRSLSHIIFVPNEQFNAFFSRMAEPELFSDEFLDEVGSELPELEIERSMECVSIERFPRIARELFDSDVAMLARLLTLVRRCGLPPKRRGFHGVCVRLPELNTNYSLTAYYLMEFMLRIYQRPGMWQIGYRTLWDSPENNVQYPIFFTSPSYLSDVSTLLTLKFVVLDVAEHKVWSPKQFVLESDDAEHALAEAMLNGDKARLSEAIRRARVCEKEQIVREQREAQEEAERKQREDEKRAAQEAEERKKKEEARRKQREAEERKKKEAEEHAAQEAEERKKRKKAELKQREAEDRAAQEAEERKRREKAECRLCETEERRKKEVEERAAQEAEEQKKRVEAERRLRETEERRKKEVEERATQEAEERKKRVEAERRLRETEERRKKEVEERAAQEAEEKRRSKPHKAREINWDYIEKSMLQSQGYEILGELRGILVESKMTFGPLERLRAAEWLLDKAAVAILQLQPRYYRFERDYMLLALTVADTVRNDLFLTNRFEAGYYGSDAQEAHRLTYMCMHSMLLICACVKYPFPPISSMAERLRFYDFDSREPIGASTLTDLAEWRLLYCVFCGKASGSSYDPKEIARCKRTLQRLHKVCGAEACQEVCARLGERVLWHLKRCHTRKSDHFRAAVTAAYFAFPLNRQRSLRLPRELRDFLQQRPRLLDDFMIGLKNSHCRDED